MMDKTKKKSKNYCPPELEILVNEVERNFATLHGKLSSKLCNTDKSTAWKTIATKVSGVCDHPPRDWMQVRFYSNMFINLWKINESTIRAFCVTMITDKTSSLNLFYYRTI